MSKTIAVFGAGPGLGSAVARRFGREGYRVALVAELAADGIEAAAFAADLSAAGAIPPLVKAIKDRFGRIDVVEYAPISNLVFTPAAEPDAAILRGLAELYLYTPVELVRAVLPDLLERAEGAILIGHGYSAVQGMPYMSGVGPVMAAARNYVYSLHGELAERGVYVGTLVVTAMIEGSAGHQALASGELAVTLPDDAEPPIVDPDDLAERYWQMAGKRDRVEEVYPPTAY